ncbi:MAG: sigma-54-dependent Fis family transcriptional regulator [Planctomycetes bacterium]|nr:sigma-54-dependent Fis family transcriptional regulator [Planctomycetota bacterium]
MILIVDDIVDVAKQHAAVVRELGHQVEVITDPIKVIPFLKSHNGLVELVLLDIRMPALDGMSLLKMIKNYNPNIGVVMATVINDIRTAVQSIRQGAYNYLIKPIQLESVDRTISSYFSNRPQTAHVDGHYSPFITECDSIQEEFRKLSVFAQTTIPVLIQGESGTGKELIAHLIHSQSPRAQEEFLAVNISAIPKDIFQSELFGHSKGAFTGAHSDKIGFFEQCHQGTLFLDEIGDLDMAQQKVLLRILQDGSYYQIGNVDKKKSNARIILATNRNLLKRINDGLFREDLYYRICNATVEIPPLRDRPGDIDVLAHYFLRKYTSQYGRDITTISPSALDTLIRYHFPGNVRELEGVINTSVLLETSPQLTSSNFPSRIMNSAKESISSDDSFNLESVKEKTIAEALEKCNGNQSKAAEMLGVSRSTLVRYLSGKKD